MSKMNEEEIWRPVVEEKYSKYYDISNLGRLKTKAIYITNSGNFSGGYHKKLHFKKFYIDKDGYCVLKLCVGGQCLNRKIHKLVAEAFIPNPDNLPQVNHIDGNKQNNTVSNLEWVSRAENIQHAFRTGLMTNDHLRGSNSKAAKVDEDIVREIRQMHADGISNSEIYTKYPQVSKTMLSNLLLRKTWKHVM